MDTTFLSYLLLLIISAILILYLYQISSTGYNNNNKNTLLNDSFFPVILDTCNSNNNTRMPVHHIGPVKNFHQHFTKRTNNRTYNTAKGCGLPTGIPELGWRNMYLSNYTKNEVPDVDQYAGIPTRSFLDNLENVDNIYRKC